MIINSEIFTGTTNYTQPHRSQNSRTADKLCLPIVTVQSHRAKKKMTPLCDSLLLQVRPFFKKKNLQMLIDVTRHGCVIADTRGR